MHSPSGVESCLSVRDFAIEVSSCGLSQIVPSTKQCEFSALCRFPYRYVSVATVIQHHNSTDASPQDLHIDDCCHYSINLFSIERTLL